MAEAKSTRELTSDTALMDEPRSSQSKPDKPRSDMIRRGIEDTRHALDEKLEALQSKVHEVGTKAKEAFSLRHHVEEHPWAMLGASVATGVVAGALLTGGDDDESEPGMMGWHSQPEGQYQPVAGFHPPAPRPTPKRSGARHDLFQTLKLAAAAALTELVREQINKHVPALGEQLDKVWKERGLTPTSAANALFSRAPKTDDVNS
jgi:ElaB/YqjD/DUF883 family membrane-anchored ribosome-binding protein